MVETNRNLKSFKKLFQSSMLISREKSMINPVKKVSRKQNKISRCKGLTLKSKLMLIVHLLQK